MRKSTIYVLTFWKVLWSDEQKVVLKKPIHSLWKIMRIFWFEHFMNRCSNGCFILDWIDANNNDKPKQKYTLSIIIIHFESASCVTYMYIVRFNHIEAFVLVMALCSILLFTFDDTISIHQMAYTNLGHSVGFITRINNTEIAFYWKNAFDASLDVNEW